MLKVNDQKTFAGYLVLAVAVVLAANFISRDLFFRLDFTDNKIYSLSESSMTVVKKIDDRLTMKVFFTDNLPAQYGNNRRYLQDLLEEYEAYAGGDIRFEFYQPESDENLPRDALKYGIQPVQLQVIENDKLEVKRVYMGMVFLYEDKRETIPVIQTTTGLEYDITTKIKKLVDREKRSIGFAVFGDQDVRTNNVSEALRQSYDVRRVSMDSEVPGDIGLLIVNGVEDSLSTEEMDHLKAFTARGGNLLLAQCRIKADLQAQMGRPIQSNIFDFIESLGLSLKENLVLDERCGSVTVMQNMGFFRVDSQVNYPFFPSIQRFGDHLTVDRLEQIRMLYASEIGYEAEDPPRVTPLFTTSNRSGVMGGGFYNLTPLENPAFKTLSQPGKVVGVSVTVESDSTASVSQAILVSDSRFFADDGGGVFPENSVFVANAVDFLMGDSDLVALRSREITTRPLEQIGDAEKARWKWANILLPPFLIIGYGGLRWRREARRAKALEERYHA